MDAVQDAAETKELKNAPPKPLRGYKLVDQNYRGWYGFQYEIGQTCRIFNEPVICEKGFHFCLDAGECFQYVQYHLKPPFRCLLVEVLGKVVNLGTKYATNCLRVINEVEATHPDEEHLFELLCRLAEMVQDFKREGDAPRVLITAPLLGVENVQAS